MSVSQVPIHSIRPSYRSMKYNSHLLKYERTASGTPIIPKEEGDSSRATAADSITDSATECIPGSNLSDQERIQSTKCGIEQKDGEELQDDSLSTDDDFTDNECEQTQQKETMISTNQSDDRGNDRANDKDCSIESTTDSNGEMSGMIQLDFVPSKVTGTARTNDAHSTTSKSKGSDILDSQSNTLRDAGSKPRHGRNQDETDESDSGEGESRSTMLLLGVGLITLAAVLAGYSCSVRVRRMVKKATSHRSTRAP